MAGIFNKKNGGGAQPAYATKADVILQRQAEIAAKLDQLLAAANSAGRADAAAQKADALAEKVSRESSYLGKQASSIYEKLSAENAGLKREMGYLAAQCENVFTRLSGMIASLEEKLGEAIKENAVDYEKVASAVWDQEEVSEEDTASFDDEVAPAAEEEGDEQLSISEGYIDYETLADSIAEKLE